MKKIIGFVLLLVFFSYYGFSLSIDLKTKFAEKSEITAIKVGATYFLEQKGIEVVNIGEDFAVWLKNLERSFISENRYVYKITVKLSYPTSLVEKRTIMEETLKFEIVLNTPLKDTSEILDNRLRRHFLKIKERLIHEAYIGGLAVATCIEELLIAKGVLRKN